MLLLSVIVACLCFKDGNSTPTPTENEKLGARIVGGTLSVLGGCPYQVSLQKNNNHICGGTLVSLRHVITAAHCFIEENSIDLRLNVYRVRGGEIDLYSNSWQTRNPFNITLHPSFNRYTLQADLAAIILQSAFSATTALAPIIFASSSPAESTNCTISGWGTVSQGATVERFLRQAQVSITNQQTCVNVYNDIFAINIAVLNDMICAGGDGLTDACQGDSGGPMICNNGLAGIVSWGYGCAVSGVPGIYVRAHVYNEWITRIVNGCNSLRNSAIILALLMTFIQIFNRNI